MVDCIKHSVHTCLAKAFSGMYVAVHAEQALATRFRSSSYIYRQNRTFQKAIDSRQTSVLTIFGPRSNEVQLIVIPSTSALPRSNGRPGRRRWSTK